MFIFKKVVAPSREVVSDMMLLDNSEDMFNQAFNTPLLNTSLTVGLNHRCRASSNLSVNRFLQLAG